jgi:predicted ATP-dependent endonuclease of OLD family
MHISSIQLKNFKRFTDLKIEGIPKEAKLVLLVGSNGSGKSSVFDALEVSNHATKGEGFQPEYYTKDKAHKFKLEIFFDNKEYNVLI